MCKSKLNFGDIEFKKSAFQKSKRPIDIENIKADVEKSDI